MTEGIGLETLIVENFRSIRGEVVVPVNAPVVLIHGPNGTGKSSLMTALALGLAGTKMIGLGEPRHLVHHGCEYAEITLATTAGPKTLRISPDDEIVGAGALAPDDSAFFAERCFLEQTKLTRLLDIYQERRGPNPDSALTRFVKELLRLDELDALVDGLHMSGDIRRVDARFPVFKDWRAELPYLQSSLAEKNLQLDEARQAATDIESSMDALLGALDLKGSVLDENDIDHAQDQRYDIESLARIETLFLRLDVLTRDRRELDGSLQSRSLSSAEANVAAAKNRQERWLKQHGGR